jgi:hypothetical protein
MSGIFERRMEELRRKTGSASGWLVGSVIVDQVYAHYQHEGLDLHHPRGGQAKYLTAPLLHNFRSYLAHIARTALDDGGQGEMIHAVEDLAGNGGVATHAPVEFGDLRKSGHPSVRLGERVIFDREPHVRRLTEAELAAKSRLRPMPPQLLGWIWWHVMHNTKPPPRRP